MEEERCLTPTVHGNFRPEERCLTPTVHRNVSPKSSPAPSITGTPVDDKSTIMGSVERVSPEPNCAICLGKLQNKSFTNSCLHQYCFNCLLEWSKVKAECPLCKQAFQSIIHNVRSLEDYDQYDLSPNNPTYPWEEPRFRYRTTMTGAHARYRVESTVPIVLQPLPPARRPQRAPWTRARRQLATGEFRRSIYERNLWVMPLQDITGRYRESSPLFYRNNPAQLHRLYPWLSRELTVLLGNSARLALVLDALLTMLQYHSISSTTTRTFLRNAIGEQHVDHFIHEFLTFARSPYDMIGFDETAEYGSYDAHTIEIPPSPPRSVVDDDSDVVVISSDDSDVEVNVEDSDEASPPSFSSRSRRHRNIGTQAVGSTEDVRIQASHDLSDSSNSDDCVIVGYVKPLHERTPEIVELDSDENIIEETVSSRDTRESLENQTYNAAPNSKHTLDMENPVASTSGFQRENSIVDSSHNISVSEKKSRTRQHKKKKTHSNRSKARTSKKSVKVKRSRSSSSSSNSSDIVRKCRSRLRQLSGGSDSLDDSPVRRLRAARDRSRKLAYTSESSSYSPVIHTKRRTSNLSKLSYSSDSSSRSPVRRHSYKETEDTRYSGRSSVEDYSYPLATRMPRYNTSYTSDNDSDFHSEKKPKLRSIVIPKTSNISQIKGISYPSTSSSSSTSVRHHENSSNSWGPINHSHKTKHKPRRHERKKKRRRKATYSSSSSEDIFVRYPKKKSSNTVIYSDSD